MKKDIPTISIDLDKKCSRCGDEGATQNGLCLKCVGERLTKHIRSQREAETGKRKGMATEYADAPEVRRVANRVINECHPHLHGARIDFIFVSKTDKDGMEQPIESKGKQQWGKARKVSGLNAYLARDKNADEPEDFFVIEISSYAWKRLDEAGRTALVDHELCHCALNADSGAPEIRAHDVEEFTEVIKRRGLWKDDVRHLVEVGAKQLKLPIAEVAAKGKRPQPAAH